MMKKFLAWVMILAMLCSLVPGLGISAGAEEVTPNTTWYAGHESETSFTLYDVADLEGLASLVNDDGNTFEGKTITLDVSFDNSATPLTTPIGDFSKISENVYACFKGTFDGNGKTVALKITSGEFVGLFGFVDSGGTVKNVSTTGDVTASESDADAGGVVCYNVGSVTNCYATGAVTASSKAGGVVCYNAGSVTNCYATGNVTASSNAGGVVCDNFGGVTNCYATGRVNGYDAGGVVGYNFGGIVTNCYATGTVNGNDVGGVAGYNYLGSVTNCYATGDVTATGSNSRAGGVVGYNDGISLGGYNYGSVTNCYATGAVEAKDYAGGVVGYNNDSGIVTNCYATGDVTASSKAGGVVGYNDGSSSVTNCYYLMGKSDKVVGDGSATNSYALTSAQMKGAADATAEAGWKEITVGSTAKAMSLVDALNANLTAGCWGWGVSTEKNNGFPTLKVLELQITVTNDVAAYDESGNTVTVTIKNADTQAVIDNSKYTVNYYKVNGDTIATTPLEKATGIGRYLYVISMDDSVKSKYDVSNFYTYDNSTSLTTVTTAIAGKPNAGFLTVIGNQKPIYFPEATVNVSAGDTVNNELVNTNTGSTVTYTSSNKNVAEVVVDSNTQKATVNVKAPGTTTIIATSTLTGTADVYASYTLNVSAEEITVTVKDKDVYYGAANPYTASDISFSKEITLSDDDKKDLKFTTSYAAGKPVGQYTVRASGLTSGKYSFVYDSGTLTVNEKVLTGSDFEVTAADKKYDGTTAATVTAVVNSDALVNGDKLGVTISGSFKDDGNVGSNKTVTYTITGLTGAKAANYALKDGSISGEKTADIGTMNLTVHYPKQMSYTYDGSEKVPDVTVEDENGKQFYDFTLKYGDETTAPKDAGTYEVSVAVDTDKYTVVTPAQNMTIKKANATVWPSAGISQLYTGAPCAITTMSAPKLGVNVTYYAVDADGKVGDKVENPMATGKYLYVITLKEVAAKNYEIGKAAGEITKGTAASEYTETANCGILTISNNVQPELYFKEDMVDKAVGDAKFTNTILGGAEGAAIKYSVQSGDCVKVNETTGEVSIEKPGSAVIKAVATKDGYDNAEARFTVVVAKKTVTIKLNDDTDMIYEGYYADEENGDRTEHLITVPYTISDPAVKDLVFTYTQRDDNAKHTPYEVNNYYVTVQVDPENELYQSNLATGYMDIVKRTLKDKDDKYFDIGDTTFTYSGECQVPTITAGDPNMGELSFRYFLNGEEVKEPTNAGTYTVKVSMTESDDFNAVTDVELDTTFTILPRVAVLNWSDSALVYNGSEQSVSATVANAVEGDTVTVTGYTGEKGTDVGTYTATATALSNSNYTLEKTDSEVVATWSITSKVVTVKAADATATVNGSVTLNLDAAGLTIASGTPTFTLTKDGNEVSLEDALKTAGSYTITWTNPDDITFAEDESSNYTIAKDATTTATLTVNRASSGGGGGGGSTRTVNVTKAEDGKVTADKTSPAKGSTVTLTVTPDEGYALDTLTVTDSKGNEIELTKVNDTTYTYTMPSGTVTVSADFVKEEDSEQVIDDETTPTSPNPSSGRFVDVKDTDYFNDPVDWAAEKGITTGKDDTHFAPNDPCTRAQIVTFLWRAAGSPAPETTDCPFTDVDRDAYYYDAVLWAVEKGITKGMTDTSFGVDKTCTRGQAVTFLHRYEGSKTATEENPFDDVQSGDFFYDSVLWANENNITNGTSANAFSPSKDCTRGQIVTFLYRDMAE